ncbi:uncharacterized protein LOC110202099 [Phascolarctos cinereus]|uniref:Uncharacterized protein LOC110202099 n=1 Tax=Phascolarctos cinereus TaxID=38626 RepID=A0A6P5JHN8_PHACI|nr:uncharacterized protein LOC110202099 [Phascolarctos cinereus]XP_020833773.1 uncharacterized protein LOC110202099 [Phascolarctos cinereus]
MNIGAKAKAGGSRPLAPRLPSSSVPGPLGTPKRSGTVPLRATAEPRTVVKRSPGEQAGRATAVPKVTTALSGPPRTSKTGYNVPSTVSRQPLVRKAEPAPGAGQASRNDPSPRMSPLQTGPSTSRPGSQGSKVCTLAKQVRSAPAESAAKAKTALASTPTGRSNVAPAEARRDTARPAQGAQASRAGLPGSRLPGASGPEPGSPRAPPKSKARPSPLPKATAPRRTPKSPGDPVSSPASMARRKSREGSVGVQSRLPGPTRRQDRASTASLAQPSLQAPPSTGSVMRSTGPSLPSIPPPNRKDKQAHP